MERVRYAGDFKETTRDGVASNSSRLYFFYNVARTDFVYTLLLCALIFVQTQLPTACQRLLRHLFIINSLITEISNINYNSKGKSNFICRL